LTESFVREFYHKYSHFLSYVHEPSWMSCQRKKHLQVQNFWTNSLQHLQRRKTVEYLNRFGNAIYKEIILEYQWRDGSTRFRSRSGPVGPKPYSLWWLYLHRWICRLQFDSGVVLLYSFLQYEYATWRTRRNKRY